MVPFHLKQQHFTCAAKNVAPEPFAEAMPEWAGPWACQSHNRRPSRAPDNGGVTFHKSCTLKQKGLLLGPR